MKFDKQQKIVLGILSALIVGAIMSVTPTVLNIIKNINQKPDYIAVNEDLDKKFPQIAKKYNAFPEIFEQKEPVLIYGYNPGDLNNAQSEIFHKKLNKLIEEENIKQKIITYKNGDVTLDAIGDKYIDSEATCTMVTQEQEDLRTYLYFIDRCFKEACIIDVKNKNYVLIDRNAEFIIKVLKKEVEPQY